MTKRPVRPLAGIDDNPSGGKPGDPKNGSALRLRYTVGEVVKDSGEWLHSVKYSSDKISS